MTRYTVTPPPSPPREGFVSEAVYEPVPCATCVVALFVLCMYVFAFPRGCDPCKRLALRAGLQTYVTGFHTC